MSYAIWIDGVEREAHEDRGAALARAQAMSGVQDLHTVEVRDDTDQIIAAFRGGDPVNR